MALPPEQMCTAVAPGEHLRRRVLRYHAWRVTAYSSCFTAQPLHRRPNVQFLDHHRRENGLCRLYATLDYTRATGHRRAAWFRTRGADGASPASAWGPLRGLSRVHSSGRLFASSQAAIPPRSMTPTATRRVKTTTSWLPAVSE